MTPEKDWKPSSLAEAKRNALMNVTLSSGTRYTIRAVSLDVLAANEGLPEDLLRIVFLDQIPGGYVAEIASNLKSGKPSDMAALAKLNRDALSVRDRVILAAVVSPKLSAKDMDAIDEVDKKELYQLARRERNVDATGKEVGADPLGYFRSVCRFYGRAEGDPARKALLLELAEIQR